MVLVTARRYRNSNGVNDDSNIAAIITLHINQKFAAAASQVCPANRIQAIDIFQPPGIDIPPMADIDPHQAIVNATVVANNNVEIPANARSEAVPAFRLLDAHLNDVGTEVV